MKIKISKSNLVAIHQKYDWHLIRNSRIFLIAVRKWYFFYYKNLSNVLLNLKKDATDDLIDWGRLEDSSKAYFKPSVVSAYTTGANISYGVMKLDPRMFDVLNTEAVKIADKICAKLVSGITSDTQKTIRKIISIGIKRGSSLDRIARELKQYIGLNYKQSMKLVSYKESLIKKYPKMSTLDINRKVKRLRQTYLNERLDSIARTETARAQNYGYVKTFENNDTIDFEVSTSPDCCLQRCAELNGTVVRGEMAYTIIPVHPKCRCCLLPVVRR